MDPIITAALRTFTRQEERFLGVIAGLPDEALNWRPGPDTNSLAVLVAHTWGSAVMWTARAGGAEPDRDRDAEFRVIADGASLADLIRTDAARVRQAVTTLAPHAFATARRMTHQGEPITVADCLIHALEHTQEHLGQALLTRQLWEQAHGTPVPPEDADGYHIPSTTAHH